MPGRFLFVLMLLSCDGLFFDTEKYNPGDFVDDDADGFPLSMDCDDNDASIHPEGVEVCDGVDQDCDGVIDNGVGGRWYFDYDADGFGDPASEVLACENPGNYVEDSSDCDDQHSESYPGALEYCDGADNDCNGVVDDSPVDGDWFARDQDGDGFGEAGSLAWACDGIANDLDCNDLNPSEPAVALAGAMGGNGSLAAPFGTIYEAMQDASDCVVALPGTYHEHIDFQGRPIRVTSIGGSANTTLDVTGLAGAAVSFANGEGADSELSGFTITGGQGHLDQLSEQTNCYSNYTCTTTWNTYCGGAIYVAGASPTLSDLVISGNSLPPVATSTSGYDTTYTYSFGGGLCVVGATLSIEDVHFDNNWADQGGAVYLTDGASLTHSRSRVQGNSATDGGAYEIDNASLTLTNTLVVWNSATTYGGAVYALSGSLDATNVTFGGDRAAVGGAVYVSSSAQLSLVNSIVTLGVPSGLQGEAGASASVDYSDTYDNSSVNSSGFDVDPLGFGSGNLAVPINFVSVTDDGDPSNDDWNLADNSPLRNVGHPATAYNDADGSRNDLGAYGGPSGAWGP